MGNPAPSSRCVRFGVFEADLSAGELRKQGLKIKLQDQPFQILALLLERPGELLTREELREKLWPGDTFVDFDHGLNNAMNRLREALGDAADTPRFIETLPRRGYRFIAPVDDAVTRGISAPTIPASPTEASAATGERPAHPPARRPFARFWLPSSALAIGLAALLLVNPGRLRQRLLGGTAPARIRSIAVLPLENLTGDSSQEYFVDGMTDELITELAQISALRVISRTSTMQYKGSKRLLSQIAQELNVDAVVEGAVVRSGDRVRISAQLIQAPTDRHLWAKSYERDLRDVLALQGEVAQAIANEVRIQVAPKEQAQLARSRPVNPAAYDNYLRAKYLVGLENKPHNENAIALLERAVALDPNFARAYAALSRAYQIKGTIFIPQESEWEEKALAAVDKALSLDPDLAEAHLAKGFLLWSHSHHFPHEESIREMQRALALNPNLDEAHHQLGSFYNHIGLFDKASAELHKALALDPNNTGARFRVGINLLYACKYQEALAVLGDSQEFFPALWGSHTAWALFHVGKREQAAARVEEFLKKYPDDEGGILTAMQAMLAAAAGEPARAEERIQSAIVRGKNYQHFHHTAYYIGSAYALMKKPEAAVKWLQMAAEDGFPCYPLFEKDSSLDPVRGDRRFVEFMARLKQQWEHYRATLGSA